jgi:hypothetical protein
MTKPAAPSVEEQEISDRLDRAINRFLALASDRHKARAWGKLTLETEWEDGFPKKRKIVFEETHVK